MSIEEEVEEEEGEVEEVEVEKYEKEEEEEHVIIIDSHYDDFNRSSLIFHGIHRR